MKDEVTGGWRKPQNKELHRLYTSTSIIRMMKSRRMRWTEYVTPMGEKKKTYGINENAGKKKTSRKTKIMGVDNIVLKCILER
jgi:hypothetical protein